MLRNLLLVALVAFATAEKLTFDNYKVVRMIPASEEHLKVLSNLNEAEGYSYWKSPSRVFMPVDVMVAPNKVADLYKILDAADMMHDTYVDNVQDLIDQESPAIHDEDAATGFGWTRYHKLEEIYAWLESLVDKYPGKIEIIDAGKTYEGRVIKGVKLSFGGNKPGVFVEGGIHAREWISPATVTYLLNEFLTSKDPAVRKTAEAYDWYIFPTFNPDGYVYTHNEDRFWRKTRKPNKGSSCLGTDANRNWDYKWMVGGASDDPCSEAYAGPAPSSEIEVKTMSEYIKSLSGKLFAYVSFHSYSQLLLFPYGHTEEHLANYDESKAIGLKTIDALAKRYGTRYVTGNIAETIYIASGTSMDWVKANLDVPVSFTYELRDTGRHGFVLPPEQIIPNGQEILDSIVAMFEEATKFGYPKPAQ